MSRLLPTLRGLSRSFALRPLSATRMAPLTRRFTSEIRATETAAQATAEAKATSPPKEESDEWYVDTEYVVPQWRRARPAHMTSETSGHAAPLTEWTIEACKGLLDAEGVEQVLGVDVGRKAGWCEWMVIGELSHSRRLLAAGEEIRRALKRYARANPDFPQEIILEGADDRDSHWLLIDTGSIMIHLMTPQGRDLYRLEEHWERMEEDISLIGGDPEERVEGIRRAFAEVALLPGGGGLGRKPRAEGGEEQA